MGCGGLKIFYYTEIHTILLFSCALYIRSVMPTPPNHK